MDCKNFGIGLIVLSATLFFGVMIGEIFNLDETRIPEIEVIEESVDLLNNSSLEDCKSVDNDLKYRTLPFLEKEGIYREIDKRDMPELKTVPVTQENKQNSGVSKKEKIEKAASESSVKLSKENITANKTLVYKEICREKENGRKNGSKINN